MKIKINEYLYIDSDEISSVEAIYKDNLGNVCPPERGKFWATEINVKGNTYLVNTLIEDVLKKIGWL